MPKLASIVLAAGASTRFGADNKLLASFNGEPLIARTIAAVREGAGAHVLVVTGTDAAAIENALAGTEVRFVPNPSWQDGLGSSIAAGVSALPPDVDAAFIVPGDMPFLDPALLRELAATFARSEPHPIVYPATAAGEQRNPVLWPRRFFADLALLSGPGGAKPLIQANIAQAIAVPCADANAFADVDTPADLKSALALSANANERKQPH